MKLFNLSVFIVFFTFFSNAQIQSESDYVQILGIVQDAGYPHIGCEKDCCELVKPGDYFVSCIGLVDKANNKRYLFDATPDMHNQLNLLEKFPNGNLIDGIFLTHAHIGHYTGLMYLGREGLGGNKIKVYALKRMAAFLRKNGPWNQLIKLKNKYPKAENFKIDKWIEVFIQKVPIDSMKDSFVSKLVILFLFLHNDLLHIRTFLKVDHYICIELFPLMDY